MPKEVSPEERDKVKHLLDGLRSEEMLARLNVDPQRLNPDGSTNWSLYDPKRRGQLSSQSISHARGFAGLNLSTSTGNTRNS